MKRLFSRSTIFTRETAAALAVAFVAAWRLPRVFGSDEALFGVRAVTPALALGLFCLLRRAFAFRDRRLEWRAYLLGLFFSAVTVVGEELKANEGFLPFSVLGLLDSLTAIISFAAVYGAALCLLFRAAGRINRGEADGECVLSRITGNGFFVFALLILCWLPAWLACWPGVFTDDSVAQFYMYYDGTFSTHHPLLHTLALGFLMMLGIERDPMGDGAAGVASYAAVQMVLMAGVLAYACRWLRRRRAPLGLRVAITLLFALLPFYPLWAIDCQKDIPFGGLALLVVLQLVDLWESDFALLRKPLWIVRWTVLTVLMMMMRNNGVYALCLFLPFALLGIKGRRVRVASLLAGCAALYLAVNGMLAASLDAEKGSYVEMLSVPLQQMGRTLAKDADALPEEGRELIEAIYPNGYAEYYQPMISDPVKWALESSELEGRVPELLSLWARMGAGHLDTYLEAFLVQNLPYLLPGAEMLYNIKIETRPIDLIPISEFSYMPRLRTFYENYDETLSLPGLSFTRLFSDTAAQVWLCLIGLALAGYRRQRQFMAAFGFLLCIWFTCLLGPAALIRYMLSFFYAVPVLLCAMLSPSGAGRKAPGADIAASRGCI